MIGLWDVDSNGAPIDWWEVSDALPGWILRSLTESYVLLQAGDGGRAGMWDLDANGQPTAWHTVSGAMAGWIMRGLDQH